MGRLSEMIFIRNQQTNRWLDVTGDDVEAWADTRKKRGTVGTLTVFRSTLEKLLLAGFCCLFMLGCGSTETVSPEITERAAELSSGSAWQKALDSHTNALATTLAAQKLTGEQTLETAQAIMAKLNAMEASLAKSEPQNGKDGDPASAPDPPAKANTALARFEVATPGDSPETLTELATRLYSQGVSVHMKTEDELKAIDAQLNGGAPVTGAIFQNNRASAVTSQRSPVRLIPRGRGVVRWQSNSSAQTCGPGGCPPR